MFYAIREFKQLQPIRMSVRRNQCKSIIHTHIHTNNMCISFHFLFERKTHTRSGVSVCYLAFHLKFLSLFLLHILTVIWRFENISLCRKLINDFLFLFFLYSIYIHTHTHNDKWQSLVYFVSIIHTRKMVSDIKKTLKKRKKKENSLILLSDTHGNIFNGYFPTPFHLYMTHTHNDPSSSIVLIMWQMFI